MATEKWISGGTSSWTDAFGSELASIANGNAILSSVALDNTSNNDVFLALAVLIASVTTGSGVPYLGLWLYELHEDGSTYGDGKFSSSAAGPPQAGINLWNALAPASTTAAFKETRSGLILPRNSKFKLVAYNQLGATLAASGNHVYYQTYDRQVS